MNVITLISGIMGVGKSTYIEENDLKLYTISTDEIRLMLGTPRLIASEDGVVRKAMININDEKVFNLLNSMIEERMLRGEYIVVDAMNIASDRQNELRELAKKHRYRINYVDIQEDMPLETILKQNKNRPEYKVSPDEQVIQKFHRRILLLNELGRLNKSGMNPVNKNNIKDTFFWKSRDLNKYKKVVIIGDIHGCYTALKQGINEFRDDYYYVFLGDYFDKGLEHLEVFNFIETTLDKDNFVYLTGNHDESLINYLKKDNDDFYVGNQFKNKTLPQLESVSKKRLRRFVSKLQVFFAFTYGGQKYFCTHGGILPQQYNNQDYPEFKEGKYDIVRETGNDIIFGIGDFQFDIDKYFEKSQLKESEDNRVIQFHGHRNNHNVELNQYDYIYNLDGGAEYGGHLRIAYVDEQGVTYDEIKNNVYDKDMVHDSLQLSFDNLTNSEIVDIMNRSKYIKSTKVSDNWVAYNFSVKAFKNRYWNRFTTTARGLIIDKKNNIYARGYSKFFNIGENNENTMESILEKVEYPVKSTVKENGYLGLLTSNGKHLSFFTKSGKTDYADMFADMFYKYMRDNDLSRNMPDIIKLLHDNNITITIEVVNIENDKHIVKYEKSKLVVLDAIVNDFDSKFNDSVKLEFCKLTQLPTTEYTILKNEKELLKHIEESDKEINTEGYVYSDSNNFMFKLKNEDYNYLKSLRGLLSNYIKYNDTNLSKLPDWAIRDNKYIDDMKYIIEEYPISKVKYVDDLDMFKVRDLLDNRR